MLVETYVSEAIDKIDEFSQVIEERLVGLLVSLHPDILLNMIFCHKLRS